MRTHPGVWKVLVVPETLGLPKGNEGLGRVCEKLSLLYTKFYLYNWPCVFILLLSISLGMLASLCPLPPQLC